MLKKGSIFLAVITVIAFTTAACGDTNAAPETAAVTETPAPAQGQEEASVQEQEKEPAKEQRQEPEESPAMEPGDPPEDVWLPLDEFCNDEEVNGFFDSLKDDPPVKLEYWVYGEGPYSVEVTDGELILDAAEALKGVLIDGVSEENPDWVADAGGNGYYFEKADGSGTGFSFLMGCFKWKDGEYHDVADFGNLPEINERIEETIPRYEYVYAADDGFYTKALNTYETEWSEEQGSLGGLRIYLGEEDPDSFIEIGRCTGDAAEDPEVFLEEYMVRELTEVVQEEEYAEVEADEIKKYEFGGKEFTGVLLKAEDKKENESLNVLVMVLPCRDSLLGEERLVRFIAAYEDEYEEEIMEALNAAAKDFHLAHMVYEQGDVKPDSPLLTFCNDEGLNAWFEKAEERLPDELVVTTDSWHAIEDPETIRAVLEALKTVRIGNESTEIVGGSGRQIYDFMDHDSGNPMSFMFFQDQFDYEGVNYDVLDWGDLDDLLPELVQ